MGCVTEILSRHSRNTRTEFEDLCIAILIAAFIVFIFFPQIPIAIANWLETKIIDRPTNA
jgi:hypothetical protein